MDESSIDESGAYTGAEREVLRQALRDSKMSARRAADLMEMSDTRLRHIINGYQPAGRGQRIAVVAPAETLARIARILEVTPEQLEAAGRPDAARELMATLMAGFVSDHRDEGDLADEIAHWAENPTQRTAPPDALRFFADAELLDELERRLYLLRAGDRAFDKVPDPPSVVSVGDKAQLDPKTHAEVERIRQLQAVEEQQEEHQEAARRSEKHLPKKSRPASEG